MLFLGHSTFRFTSTTGKVIVIDPFLTQNPRAPAKYKDVGDARHDRDHQADVEGAASGRVGLEDDLVQACPPGGADRGPFRGDRRARHRIP